MDTDHWWCTSTDAAAAQPEPEFAERWVRSVKQECLSKLILFGEGSLKRALTEFAQHYHIERNHEGKDNILLFPNPDEMEHPLNGYFRCRERLGGLLRYYCRAG